MLQHATELIIRVVEHLDDKFSLVELYEPQLDRCHLKTWIMYRHSNESFLLIPAEWGDADSHPKTLEFHYIGNMNAKKDFFAITNSHKEPFGIWTKESEYQFKRKY